MSSKRKKEKEIQHLPINTAKKSQTKNECKIATKDSASHEATTKRRNKRKNSSKKAVPKEKDSLQGKSDLPSKDTSIDDIFDVYTQKKSQNNTCKKVNENKEQTSIPESPPEDDMGLTRHGAKKAKRRKMADGTRIFTSEELGINADSGGTDLCPFDCDCCF